MAVTELGISALAESDGIKVSWTAPIEHLNHWASLARVGESDYITYEYLGAGESGIIPFPVQAEGFYEVRLYTSNALGSLVKTIPVTVGSPEPVDPTDPIDPIDPVDPIDPGPALIRAPTNATLRRLHCFKNGVLVLEHDTAEDDESLRQLGFLGFGEESGEFRVEVRNVVLSFPELPDEVVSWTK